MEEEFHYANEARKAERKGVLRLAADLYLLSVRAATDKLSETRIHSFSSYLTSLKLPPASQEHDHDDDGSRHRHLIAETKDFDTLVNSFLNNPDEPTVFRAQAAFVLAETYRFDRTGIRDFELTAICARRCIQECLKASTEERNQTCMTCYGFDGTIGSYLDDMRNAAAERLNKLEFPAEAHASQIAMIPYPVIATSYRPYANSPLVELFGDGMSLDHLARRLTVGGVTCDCCGKERDQADLDSLLGCARCQMTYYCSADCQRRQWRDGGHKKACRKPGEFRKGDAIRLEGLKATPQYNNCVGVAVRPADHRGGEEERRWAVRSYETDGPIKMLSIKESNMRRIRPADIKL